VSKDGRGTLSLAAIEGKLMPEEVTYQARLRAAMAGVAGEADVVEVVKSIVDGAKKGDRNAQKMFFEYIVGVKNAPKKIEVHNHYPDTKSAGKNVEAEAREALQRTLSKRRNGHPVGVGGGDDDEN
jgi:plasmid stability protein